AVPSETRRVAGATAESGRNGSCCASTVHRPSNPISSYTLAWSAKPSRVRAPSMVSIFMLPAYDISADSGYRPILLEKRGRGLSAMSETFVRLEIRERVAHFTLDRPDRGNAINLEMAQELADTAARLADDPGVGAVLLRGLGPNFCVGGDVKTFATFG